MLRSQLIAAVLALVSVALTKPSEAKIVYTPTNVQVDNPYNLDLNNDGITDFTIWQIYYSHRATNCRDRWLLDAFDALVETPAQGNGADLSAKGWAAALRSGETIGHNQSFFSDQNRMAEVQRIFKGYQFCQQLDYIAGPWLNVSNRYLGLQFQIKGQTHYGWAMFSVQVGYVYIHATLTGYAYETIPGRSLKAGQRKEAAEDPTNEGLDHGASLTTPIPDIPHPASLGMLALGAQDVRPWLRKESALEGHWKGALL